MLALLGASALIFLVGAAVHRFRVLRPAAITVGPETTIYFRPDPSISIRVHEAVHRRQMRETSTLERLWNALRYNFDFDYRLEEEAEAKAAELCLQIHKFTEELPSFTSRRSERLATQYRAWTWEKVGVHVPDRVGRRLDEGRRCHEILAEVELDLSPGEALDDEETLKLAAFRFLQRYGSDEVAVESWKARLRLSARVQTPVWSAPAESLPFELIWRARARRARTDTTISPDRAGSALHDLTYHDARPVYAQLNRPAGRYGSDVTADSVSLTRAIGSGPVAWSRALRRALGGRLEPDAVERLSALEGHPLHGDFEIFARASGADIVGTRYRFPIPPGDERLAETDLAAVKRAFGTQWGRAVLASHRGEPERAAGVLRLVVGGALNLVEHSPFEADVVVALEWLDRALSDLDVVEEAAGGGQARPPAAVGLGDGRGGSGSGSRVLDALFSREPHRLYAAMPAIAADPDIPHALRMSAYRTVSLADVCLEERARLEGRDAAAHRGWRVAVENGLVRGESDRLLLDFARARTARLLETARISPVDLCDLERGLTPNVARALLLAPASLFPGGVDVPGGTVAVD